jgi:hypothetical protein
MTKTTATRLKPVILTSLITGVGLAAAACGTSAVSSSAAARPATSAPAAATTAPPPPPAPLACVVHARAHPVAGTMTGVRVRTAPHASIVETAHYGGHLHKQDARASAVGRHTFSAMAGGGRRIVVHISVSRLDRSGACATSFRAHQPPPPVMAAPAPAPMAPTPMAPTPMAPTPMPTMMAPTPMTTPMTTPMG